MTTRELTRLALCLACGLASLAGPTTSESSAGEFLRQYFKWHCHDLGGCYGYYPTCWQAWPCGPQHCPVPSVPVYGPVAPFQTYTPEGPLEGPPPATVEEVPLPQAPPPPPPAELKSPQAAIRSSRYLQGAALDGARSQETREQATPSPELIGNQAHAVDYQHESHQELSRQQSLIDQGIADQIRQEFLRCEGLGAFDSQIRVRDGKVWLYGRVENDSTRDALLRVARRVPGVVEVEDRMFPRSPQPSIADTRRPAALVGGNGNPATPAADSKLVNYQAGGDKQGERQALYLPSSDSEDVTPAHRFQAAKSAGPVPVIEPPSAASKKPWSSPDPSTNESPIYRPAVEKRAEYRPYSP